MTLFAQRESEFLMAAIAASPQNRIKKKESVLIREKATVPADRGRGRARCAVWRISRFAVMRRPPKA
jgi:hypothetical protein